MSSIMEEAVLAEDVSVERDHIRGPLDAPVTLVEYGDYQCPFCATANEVVHAIEDRMSDQVRFVFRHFPMTTVHPHAERAAEAAEAAGKQNHFWAMHDALLKIKRIYEPLRLLPSQRSSASTFRRSPAISRVTRISPKFGPTSRNGVLSGVNGTPAFYINGTRHDGSWDLASLSSALLAAV